ncbi:hypothetical protein CJ030_MR7G013516 [Morella rubra]|uniref:Uncharacterized protein n=1 Tax=Morella rubra TaxID=262757 RepID=A0A6A1V4G6_9ROSI|nr:hypothetical protein CJ030_MR7G013516 [Morella rubra]
MSGTAPKNGERYGAPLIEEWEEDDEVADLVPGEKATVGEVVVGEGAYVETTTYTMIWENVREGLSERGHKWMGMGLLWQGHFWHIIFVYSLDYRSISPANWTRALFLLSMTWIFSTTQ